MKKLAYFFGLLTALLTCSRLYAQNITSKMDSAFNTQSRNGLLMGNLLVAGKGKAVYQHSFGFRDIAVRQANTPASAFGLASISKQFTAVAVLQLKEKGKLRLDDRFVQYFPDFPFPEITIRQLLAHTSGLPEYELFDALVAKEPNRIFTNGDVIPALKLWGKGLYFKPGDDWHYSSMNYCLLALLIEKLSGKTLQSYLEKSIYRPAGMQHTYLENLLIKKNNPDRTVDYQYLNYWDARRVNVDSIPDDHQMIFNLGGFSGQGGLTSTTEDLLRFDNAFFSGKLISANGLEEALTPVKLNNGHTARASGSFGDLGASCYGLGWFILNDTTKGKIVWHDGGRPGISTIHLHNLRTDQTVILLQNTADNSHDVAVCAYHLLNQEPAQIPGIPLIQIYARTLVNEGADAATVKLQSLRSNPAYQMPSDHAWVELGYQLLYGKPSHILLGVEALKTASLLLPDSWYVSQGYAAALEQSGKKDLAILMYKKCIAENPKADYAVERLKTLESK
ncbi:MAG TPA: serine hydrolase domain-containing protein [Mucilaginibacter sp.]|jgi:CubicO group peptidase (beta-lactamase class C family)